MNNKIEKVEDELCGDLHEQFRNSLAWKLLTIYLIITDRQFFSNYSQQLREELKNE